MSDDPLDLDAFFAQLEAQVAGETAAAEAPAPTTTAVVERREAPRVPVEAVGREVKLSIRGGSDAKPINLSETGLLAETTSRLRPGGAVELLLQIDGVRRSVRATVVRSMVHSLGPTVFRTAFKFEERTKLPERK
jgi:hypothetical protein